MVSPVIPIYLPQSRRQGYYTTETGEITVTFEGELPQRRKDRGILYHVCLDGEPGEILLYRTVYGIFINIPSFIDNYTETEEIRNQIDYIEGRNPDCNPACFLNQLN